MYSTELWQRLKNLATTTADFVDRLLGNDSASAEKLPAPQAIPIEADRARRRKT